MAVATTDALAAAGRAAVVVDQKRVGSRRRWGRCLWQSGCAGNDGGKGGKLVDRHFLLFLRVSNAILFLGLRDEVAFDAHPLFALHLQDLELNFLHL